MKKFWLRGEFLGAKSEEFTWFFRSFGNCTFSQWVEINSEEPFKLSCTCVFTKFSWNIPIYPETRQGRNIRETIKPLCYMGTVYKIATTWVCFPGQSTPKLMTKNLFVGMQAGYKSRSHGQLINSWKQKGKW